MRTDLMKLIGAFCEYAAAPKNTSSVVLNNIPRLLPNLWYTASEEKEVIYPKFIIIIMFLKV